MRPVVTGRASCYLSSCSHPQPGTTYCSNSDFIPHHSVRALPTFILLTNNNHVEYNHYSHYLRITATQSTVLVYRMTIGQRLLTPFYGSAKPLPADMRSCCASHQAGPRLLACSIDSAQQRLFALRELDRKLCEDRKLPWEHLLPGSLAKSVRVHNKLILKTVL